MGKADPSSDAASKHTPSGQQQSLPAVSQAAAAPPILLAAHSALAASPSQLQDPLPSKLATSGKQALLQPSALVLHQTSASINLPSTRQPGPASAVAQADGLMAKELSSASAKAGELTGPGSVTSPRQRRDPSPAELAIAKQKSLGAGAAAPVTEDAQAFVLSPRQERDPSPAELALIRHESSTSKVLHNADLTHFTGTAIMSWLQVRA